MAAVGWKPVLARADEAVAVASLQLSARERVLVAAIVGGVLVVIVTELLSAFRGLTVSWVFAAWGAIGLGSAVAVFLVGRHGGPDSPPRPRRGPASKLDLVMSAWIALVGALTGAVALVAVPSTWDSMTYHLARVAHWSQNQSVAFYPTHILRQLYQPPWAEYAALHLLLLGGGDRLVNLVQWLCSIASLIGVSVIAKQLGATPRGQLISAVVGVTIPMGILQASTTQNDYAAALWLVCLVSALLALESRPGSMPVLGAGASLGLALLTKGTSYVFAAPFLAVFLLAGRRRARSTKIAQAAVIGLCAVALNAPHYARSHYLFGSPLGPGGEGPYRFANDEISLPILLSNVLRNVGLHAGTPWLAANVTLERAIGVAHDALGIAVDDPRSTWPTTRLEVRRPVAHEDLAGNGLHLVLIVAALVAATRLREDWRRLAFAGSLVAAFLLFCLLLKWQPWHSRLLLPLFVLATPLVGLALERLRSPSLAVVVALLAISSSYFLFRNHALPLAKWRTVAKMTRADQRAARAGPAYAGAARVIAASGCRHVGVVLGGDDPEYFLWALLADAGWRGRLEPVRVVNVSARLSTNPPGSVLACALVGQHPIAPTGSPLSIGGQDYRPAWSTGNVQIFTPVGRRTTAGSSTRPAAAALAHRSAWRLTAAPCPPRMPLSLAGSLVARGR
jgi:Dolichyl-phosphate-mannose-protein mannosyltransferase